MLGPPPSLVSLCSENAHIRPYETSSSFLGTLFWVSESIVEQSGTFIDEVSYQYVHLSKHIVCSDKVVSYAYSVGLHRMAHAICVRSGVRYRAKFITLESNVEIRAMYHHSSRQPSFLTFQRMVKRRM